MKGVDRLILALDRLDSKVGLVIAGEGALKPVLMDQVRSLGLEQRVLFCGGVPHDRLTLYYQAGDVLALASSSEGWPTIILEAMATGLPVVSPSVGGVSEILTDRKFGLLTESNHPEVLARALTQALDSDWDRTKLCSHARIYSWDAIAQEYVKLYDKIKRAKGEG